MTVPSSTPTELLEQAQRVAVHLEGECARHEHTLHTIREYAKNLVGEWGSGHIGLDLLAILNGENDEQVQP